MSKALDSFEWLCENGYIDVKGWQEDVVALDCINSIEKSLKALEIIKRLPEDYIKDLIMFIRGFPDETFGDFIAWGGDETPILIEEEEFNLLKEVLQ